MVFKVTRTQHVLAVDDFDAEVAYFVEELGFTEYNRVDGWSFLHLGDFWLMVGDCRGEKPARETGNHSWFAYVNCEGIDELYSRYRARRVLIKEPIADKPWGMREFLVETPEGHRIKFGQALH
ncbi:MAG: VOC family protein [Gammaproteobacteria bacterium]|nr:glyoxalase [Gammaproteobacteria bacterium]